MPDDHATWAQTRECRNADGTRKYTLDRKRAKQSARRLGMKAYRCSLCGSWHVGHAPKKPSRQRHGG